MTWHVLHAWQNYVNIYETWANKESIHKISIKTKEWKLNLTGMLKSRHFIINKFNTIIQLFKAIAGYFLFETISFLLYFAFNLILCWFRWESETDIKYLHRQIKVHSTNEYICNVHNTSLSFPLGHVILTRSCHLHCSLNHDRKPKSWKYSRL